MDINMVEQTYIMYTVIMRTCLRHASVKKGTS